MIKKKRIPFEKWAALLLAVLFSFSGIIHALAATTTIGTANGTSYFEFYSESGEWADLLTPRHVDNSTGNIAYCLEHDKDSPGSSASYTDFDPGALLNSTVQNGLRAIVEHGYPSTTGGFSADQAQYATANAIRAYLSEVAGIGYRFMDLSRSGTYVRAKSGYASLFSWMEQLVQYGRSASAPSLGSITVSPQIQQWQSVGGNLVATVSVSLSGVSSYTYTSSIVITTFILRLDINHILIILYKNSLTCKLR